MKYTIYEDPLTRRFALLPLPSRFVEGDRLPVVATGRWFGSSVEAIAALTELLNREDCGPDGGRSDDAAEPVNGWEFH